jgi:hypothetical protein
MKPVNDWLSTLIFVGPSESASGSALMINSKTKVLPLALIRET